MKTMNEKNNASSSETNLGANVGQSGFTPNRRSYLKAVAVSGLSLGSVGSVIAKPRSNFDRTYQQALKVREARGQNGFLHYLEKHDIGYHTRREQKVFPWTQNEESDGVSTQRYFSSMLSIDFTLAYDCSNTDKVWIDCNWFWDETCQAAGQGGETPYDVIGMYWSANSYQRIADSQYLDTHVYVGGTRGDLDPNGIAVEYDDYGDWYDGYQASSDGCTTASGNFGCKAWKEDPSEPPSSRLVSGDYTHTWGTCGIQGVSIGTGGLNINWGCSDQEAQDNSFSYTFDEGESSASGCW